MEDKYLWLEDILDKKSLKWVDQQNKLTIDTFQNNPKFTTMVSEIQEILESKEKIPFLNNVHNGYVYNLWTDEVRVQGLLRRASIAEYKKSDVRWEDLIDLDLLSKEDGQTWVYHGMDFSPNHKRVLVFLSPGGSDADIMREFDLETKTFVEDGFELPVSKGGATWASDNELFVYRDFGLETMSSSGYPRTIRKWVRGEVNPETTPIFDIPAEEMRAYATSFHFNGNSKTIILRDIDFYHKKYYLYANNQIEELNIPQKSSPDGCTLEYLYFGLREDWNKFLSGDFLAYNFQTKKCELLYRPKPNASIYFSNVIKDGILLIVDVDVKSTLLFCSKKNSIWTTETIEFFENGSMGNLITDDTANDFFITYESINNPISYFYGFKNKIEGVVKKQPSFFNYEDIELHQHFVKSLDGTMIPYFLAHKKGMKFDGKNPTILYGYGGFEVTLKSRFSNILGRAWLDKGGVYVLSNIRGGGEYGPAWHQAALKENRDRAYQDFFAIAEDLIAKKITTPEHLGAQGGSNGGLLMGVCFTQRPDLFKAINCGVPLLDMHRYHKLLAGHSWVAEYGDPDDEQDGKYIRALSPYQRIDKDLKNYPVIYLNTSTKDDRVHPGHARKFAAKLEEYGFNYHYYENINGGHAGFSNLLELAFIQALDYAFFWKYLK